MPFVQPVDQFVIPKKSSYKALSLGDLTPGLGLSMVKLLRRKVLCRTQVDPPCLIQLTCPPVPCQLNITTGTVAPLFKPHAILSVKVTLLQIFRATIPQNLLFWKRFSKNDAQVTGFEVLSHF